MGKGDNALRRGQGGRGRGGGATPHDQAADIVAELLRAKDQRSRGASIKSLVYGKNVLNKKAVYALCCETLKHLNIIKEVLKESEFSLLSGGKDGAKGNRATFPMDPTRKAGLVYVWVYELLFGQWKKIPKFRKFTPVAKQEDLLREAHGAVKTKASTSGAADPLLSPLESKTFPRYLRVNTLKLSVDEAYAKLAAQYGSDQVKRNKFLDDVLELPPTIRLYDHEMIRGGSLIQQGLSSCMPVHALKPLLRTWTLLDACSAPGNKTTQLAAHLAGTEDPSSGALGQIFAFDLDPKRFQRLYKNVKHCGAEKIVRPELRDFLSVDPLKETKFAEVRAILLDPSCSGSGTIHSRGDFLLGNTPSAWNEQTEADKRRIDTLAAFQEKCLRHALKFPKVERVVYSTCSIHVRENETVVASVLAEAERLGFKLEKALPDWPRRGFPLFDDCENLVRVNPNKDKTDGFFLALFVRDSK